MRGLGYLRTPTRAASGALVHRCAAEPIAAYVRKGGDAVDTAGRVCLCNGLLTTVGLGQRRPGGADEPAVVTIGQDLGFLDGIGPDGRPYTAAEVIDWMPGAVTPAQLTASV
ncbi:hypothetical protein ACFV98_26795 [Streptomyces violascens]|uniref:hypothetical protein n=1 Tax=Streptomyces violascens TaxID=67381 RepID=UPI0036537946